MHEDGTRRMRLSSNDRPSPHILSCKGGGEFFSDPEVGVPILMSCLTGKHF